MNAAKMTPGLPILIVDDEEMTLKSCEVALLSSGLNNLICCQDSRKAMKMLRDNDASLVLLDLSMPYISGEELLRKIYEEFPDIPVIIITGANDVETAVKCMKNGAYDYMLKPIERNRLISGVRRAIELKDLQQENIRLKKRILSDQLEFPEAFENIITRNKTMHSIFKYLEAIARTSQPVLITGETGVGKELMARAIHTIGGGQSDFVSVNIAGLDDNVFSDTLFGHKKGAFTGADSARPGLIEKAAGGTLFLDEIGDLSLASQVKLLRLLQEREYFPLGSDLARRADVRIVVATNQDIQERLELGRFRKDLYYRLRTHRIHMPPLRERRDDIPILVDHFLEDAARSLGKNKPTPPKELYTLLTTYDFPGNIRELKSMIFDAVSKHHSRMLSLDAFKSFISQEEGKSNMVEETEETYNRKLIFTDSLPSFQEAGRLLVQEALKRSSGNQTIAARLLGISQQALSKRLNKMKQNGELGN